jgi:hypothetical protein
MSQYQISESRIILRETISTTARILLALAGLLPLLLAPYEFLVRPTWEGFSIAYLLAILFSLIAVIIGVLFLSAGLFGLNKWLIFEKETSSVIFEYKSALLPLKTKIYSFRDIVSIDIRFHDWTDGASTYGLQFQLTNNHSIEIGAFEKKLDAEKMLSQISNFIQ